MIKTLLSIFVAAIFFTSEAWSIVTQSASSAMSYRNVVKATKTVETKTEPLPEVIMPKKEKIDLKNSVSKNLSLKPFEDFDVLLIEEKGYRWEASYSNNIIILGKSLVSDERQMTFKQISEGDAEIFFDYISPDGQTVLSKMIYIKAK